MADKIDLLIAALNGADYRARIDAAEQLGRDGSGRALEALYTVMQPYTWMRANSDEANVFYFTTALILAENRQFHWYRMVVDEEAPFVRSRVSTMLNRVGRDRAVSAAIAMLQSAQNGERYWAAATLDALKDVRASAALLEAQAHESDYHTRRVMLLALIDCGTTDALSALNELLKSSSDGEVRRVAGLAIEAIQKRTRP